MGVCRINLHGLYKKNKTWSAFYDSRLQASNIWHFLQFQRLFHFAFFLQDICNHHIAVYAITQHHDITTTYFILFLHTFLYLSNYCAHSK